MSPDYAELIIKITEYIVTNANWIQDTVLTSKADAEEQIANDLCGLIADLSQQKDAGA